MKDRDEDIWDIFGPPKLTRAQIDTRSLVHIVLYTHTCTCTHAHTHAHAHARMTLRRPLDAQGFFWKEQQYLIKGERAFLMCAFQFVFVYFTRTQTTMTTMATMTTT